MNFLDLPEEIKLYIFQRIPKKDLDTTVRLTCKAFYDLTFDPSLWHDFEVNWYRLDSQYSLDLLQRISEHVEHIGTWNGSHDNLAILVDKKVTFSGLQSVDLDLDSDDIEHVNRFLCRHPTVKDVSLCGPWNTILDIIHTLSNVSGLNLRKLHLSCTDEGGCDNGDFDGLMKFVLQHIKHLEILSIHCKDIPDDVAHSLLSLKDITLKRISLCDCSLITQASFIGMENFTTLVSLSLDYTKADDNALEQISRTCPKLRSLSVEGCSLVTDVGFVHIAEHCKELRDLFVNSLEMQSPEGRNITDLGLSSLAQGCQRLGRLVINKCPGVSSTGLTAVAKHCRDLEEISVAECLSVTDESVMALAVHSSNLRKVNLNSCLQVTSDAVSKLVVGCEHMHSLHLETCRFMSKLNFDGILANVDNLAMDNVNTRNGNVDDAATEVEGIYDTITSSKRTQSTAELDLDKTVIVKQNNPNSLESDFQDPRNAVSTDYSVVPNNNKTELSTLESKNSMQGKQIIKESIENASDNQNIAKSGTASDESLSKNSANINENRQQRRQTNHIKANIRDYNYITPKHSHIRVLRFGYSSSLTDVSVRQIGRHCPDLVDLSIRGCHSLSDSSVRFLIQRCRSLQTLDISGGSAVKSTDLTDTCLLAVSEYSSAMRNLFVMKNDLITTAAVSAVLRNCRHLDSLCVSCSRKSAITQEKAIAMAKTLPRRVRVSMDNRGCINGTLVMKCLN
ncbi:uncharacterized protein [Argopecten irradians]|uniref:uncharacterized protein n=1 Tax=Argopecten irradians TaxID=31199 RepID=UPI00372483AD